MAEIVRKILERLSGDRVPVSGARARDLLEQQQIFELEQERVGVGEPWVAGIHKNKRKPVVDPNLQQAIDEGLFPPVD